MTKKSKTVKRTRKSTVRTDSDGSKSSEFVETYRSLKPGEVELTEYGRTLKKLYDKALK